MKRQRTLFIIAAVMLAFSLACNNPNTTKPQEDSGSTMSTLLLMSYVDRLVEVIFGAGTAPVLNNLVITGSGSNSITIARPTLSTAGDPEPTLHAYIGLSNSVWVIGSFIYDTLQGPIDVSMSGCEFKGLTEGTTYTILVEAHNSAGYSIRQIMQRTSEIAPVMNSLSISYSDAYSITVAQPTFSTAGKPAPAVQAYIGLSDTISVSGATVSGALQGPLDVSAYDGSFWGLTPNNTYKIIVVAENNAGYSVQQIIQGTAGIAPLLNSLSVTGFDTGSISIAQPTFSTAGNPAPTVEAYIGRNGSMSVFGQTVNGALQGPIDVSTGGYQFSGLDVGTSYMVVVVAKNSIGYSTRQIAQSTEGAPAAPVLSSLSVSAFDTGSITLAQPTFSTAGTPTPAVQAYIGLNDIISVSGSAVSGAIQGPIDVSQGGFQFSGLSTNTAYKIIVTAINSSGYSVQQIIQGTAGMAPVLNSLSISGFDTGSISVARPTFSTAGNPAPSVQAYIGLNDTIVASGAAVSGALQGPVDVSSGGYQFSGLAADTTYKIIIVAQNNAGYSVQQIIQGTTGMAPVMNSLSISGFDDDSITIAQPTFSTAGNPAPTVRAFIGYNGLITVLSGTVYGYLQEPADVSAGGYQFSGLNDATSYTIIVVAKNSIGYSVQLINQGTAHAPAAPVLNSLSVSSFDTGSITVAQPTFSTAGNPTPTVQAYIGLNGTITLTGAAVSGALQGPVDVSAGGYQFSGLGTGTTYKIIVVAQNSAGYSTQQIIQGTAGIAPVLNSLSVSAFDSGSITIARPTLSTAGNPAPTVRAYIGIDGIIGVLSGIVYGYTQGPRDVSTGGYQFSGLSTNTAYKIIVVAENGAGYSVQQIVQSTTGVAPVLNGLSISDYDTNSITVARPTFSTAGNPAPTVRAYIGLNGVIYASGGNVYNTLQGPKDVSTGSYQFNSLAGGVSYKIIVVAENSYGYSVESKVQSTCFLVCW